MMKDAFSKYPPYSDSDVDWGIFVTTCGYSKVKPGMHYPPKEHPSSYHFDIEKGRILQDYQIVYITRGEGHFESASLGKKKIAAGTMIVIVPHEWHSYKPSEKTGWDEYWIGFKGPLASQMEKKKFISKSKSILTIGINDQLVEKFLRICKGAQDEKPGFQQVIASEAFSLIGSVTALANYKTYENTDTERIIAESKIIFTENFESNITAEEVATRLNIGYSRFRKIFKQYTGLAPGQYLLHLKIQKAKEMVASSHLTFKEIADQLGFENGFYFSRLFKVKTGLSPFQFRQMMQQGIR